ncbi:unnamed protein product [Blepharisma stoltei]|uniref:Uncharacterized protein n=1 Tax=Blepharisma stoltei TaxID=1481888 RepID=A0AAU9IUE5_9CILI|nr:unnamed protein product [Blepharisma stoltei]
MELLQEILCGKNPDLALREWSQENASQLDLKTRVQSLVQNLPNSSEEIIEVIKDPLFSLDIAPNLIQSSIDNNLLAVIEAIIINRGCHINSDDLGRLFIYLLSSQLAFNHTTKANFKVIKSEAERQGLSLLKKEKYRYYMLGLLISNTKSYPKMETCPENSLTFFNFVLKYLLYHTNASSNLPDSERFLQFLSASLNYIEETSNLEETLELINEHILFKEKLNEALSVIETQPHLLPVKPLSKLNRVTLK